MKLFYLADEEFDQLCFDYGIELDDIVSENIWRRKYFIETGVFLLQEAIPESNGKDVEYKIDIPANRYDILCLEGLSRALKIFLQK